MNLPTSNGVVKFKLGIERSLDPLLSTDAIFRPIEMGVSLAEWGTVALSVSTRLHRRCGWYTRVHTSHRSAYKFMVGVGVDLIVAED